MVIVMVIYGINTNMAVLQPINILHSDAWQTTEGIYILDADAWQTVKFAYMMIDDAWTKVYDYSNHTVLYGTSDYTFTPTGTAGNGNVSANNGLPSDYTSAEYGDDIWDTWVGTLVYPTGNYIDLKFTADNQHTMYANQTEILTGNDWRIWDTVTITTVPGEPLYISARLVNTGGDRGFAGYIKNEDGSYLTKTSTAWVSA